MGNSDSPLFPYSHTSVEKHSSQHLPPNHNFMTACELINIILMSCVQLLMILMTKGICSLWVCSLAVDLFPTMVMKDNDFIITVRKRLTDKILAPDTPGIKDQIDYCWVPLSRYYMYWPTLSRLSGKPELQQSEIAVLQKANLFFKRRIICLPCEWKSTRKKKKRKKQTHLLAIKIQMSLWLRHMLLSCGLFGQTNPSAASLTSQLIYQNAVGSRKTIFKRNKRFISRGTLLN